MEKSCFKCGRVEESSKGLNMSAIDDWFQWDIYICSDCAEEIDPSIHETSTKWDCPTCKQNIHEYKRCAQCHQEFLSRDGTKFCSEKCAKDFLPKLFERG